MNVAIFQMTRVTVGILAIALFAPGCSPVVKVDVQCDKLCMSSPGPTLPGFSSLDAAVQDGGADPLDATESTAADADEVLDATIAAPDVDRRLPIDAGIQETNPAVAVEWLSILAFNDVLKQMPNGSSSDETKVLLTTLSLDSTENLDFVATVDVFIKRGGKADGPISAKADAADGGVAADTGSGALPCETLGGMLSVAHFQPAGEASQGPHLPLGLLSPGLNLFNCVKDDPTEFHVAMTFRPGRHPERETPLVLSTCVRSESHMGFP